MNQLNDSRIMTTKSGNLTIITIDGPDDRQYIPESIDELKKKREVLQLFEQALMMEWSNFNQGLSEEDKLSW